MGLTILKADRLACLARFAQWAVTRLALLCAADVLGGMPARLRSCHLAQRVRTPGRRSFCLGRSSSSHCSGSWPDRRAQIRPPRSRTASPAWFAPVTPAIRLHTPTTKALPPVATTPWLSPTSPSLPNICSREFRGFQAPSAQIVQIGASPIKSMGSSSIARKTQAAGTVGAAAHRWHLTAPGHLCGPSCAGFMGKGAGQEGGGSVWWREPPRSRYHGPCLSTPRRSAPSRPSGRRPD